jgi:hypothetical protein
MIGVDYGTEITIAPTPSLVGYTFTGWNTTGVVLEGGQTSFNLPDNDVVFT